MPSAEDLKAQIGQVEDLQSVVKTMKALAAVSIRQYQQAVESLEDYFHTVEQGFQILLRRRYYADASLLKTTGIANDEEPYALMAIAFGSDQGLCGQFNEQAAQHVTAWLDQHQEAVADLQLWVVGARILPYLETQYDIQEVLTMANSAQGIIDPVEDLLLAIEQHQRAFETSRIMLFYNRPKSAAAYAPTTFQLLPLSRDWLLHLEQAPWPTKMLPTFTMDWPDLLSSLIRQYLFVVLYRAFAASLAAENASRLAAMQSAESNIGDRLDDLNSQYRRQRQSAITSELLDVVAGFEALTGEG
ncbi:MAG: F0F1 ATP synthase subunit gamma [Elainellaceae cyanobacterium]